MGRLHFTRNEFPEALEDFAKTLELDPSSIKAYDNLGVTRMALGHFDSAAADFQTAVKLGGDIGRSFGMAVHQSGQTELREGKHR